MVRRQSVRVGRIPMFAAPRRVALATALRSVDAAGRVRTLPAGVEVALF